MDTSLHSAGLTVDELHPSQEMQQEVEEEEHHIHLPNPSFWPLLLSAAILVEVAGLLFIPDAPWLSIIAAPFILWGILGWALEDPMGAPGAVAPQVAKRPAPPAKEVLDQARATLERIVTIASTAWSAHPVKVDIEEDHGNEGVVLAINGKVELQAQRDELEAALRALPGVLDVKNFVVAEDLILPTAYSRIENLKTQGKLDGAQNVEVLVENYILHLYGDVPNTKMKYTLERELVGIPGARVIVNHIGLNKEIPGNLGRTRNV
jgi:hypothetical protein